MAWKNCPCGRRFVPRTGSHRYCSPACRERFRVIDGKPSRRQRYGGGHRRLRAAVDVVVQAGEAVCTRCTEPIAPGTPWHLDHDDQTGGYRGPAHASCNSAAGAAKGNLDARMAGAGLDLDASLLSRAW